MAGADLPLDVASFAEKDAQNLTGPGASSFQLPPEWRDRLEIVSKLGEGAFGKVFKCRVRCGLPSGVDNFVSVKLIIRRPDMSEKAHRMIAKELAALEQMNGATDTCVSAVGAPDFIETQLGWWIMMPYFNGGELFDLMKACNKKPGCTRCQRSGRRCWSALNERYTTAYILALFHDVLAGVAALHGWGAALHTDLKPENIMLNCQGSECHAAVVDLGLVCFPFKKDCRPSGTPLYIAPEIWKKQVDKFSQPSRDVWSLGVILYELMYDNSPPWYKKGLDTIKSYDPYADPNIPGVPGRSDAGQRIDQLVTLMLVNDPDRRISLEQAMSVLEGIIRKDYGEEPAAIEMLDRNPTQRGAFLRMPSCLYTTFENAPDIGDERVRRANCLDQPEAAQGLFRCGFSFPGSTQCCKCKVKRHGEKVKAYFRMQQCQ